MYYLLVEENICFGGSLHYGVGSEDNVTICVNISTTLGTIVQDPGRDTTAVHRLINDSPRSQV